jgi:hypothetical protein
MRAAACTAFLLLSAAGGAQAVRRACVSEMDAVAKRHA